MTSHDKASLGQVRETIGYLVYNDIDMVWARLWLGLGLGSEWKFRVFICPLEPPRERVKVSRVIDHHSKFFNIPLPHNSSDND